MSWLLGFGGGGGFRNILGRPIFLHSPRDHADGYAYGPVLAAFARGEPAIVRTIAA